MKFTIGLCVGIVIAVLFFLVQPVQKLGIATNQAQYQTATNTSMACGVTTSTLIVATQSGRTSFAVSILSTATNTITVCKAAQCVLNAGGILLSVSSSPVFAQTDGYTGAYSCITAGSSTIGISHSQ